ncbi:MarR family winged helix-turn-helix transcriptional regulator [Natronococcus wangiae]|uniref:MarR family winged helix-turn-helix transcriptional regulator n=1 Tax=Natronococcus wangiae TaxID=3068275 RepID=UPI00273FD698|nr:MarR family transcriptional regulator [Natronococcus sp. AD5]
MDNPTIRDSVGYQLASASKHHRNYFTEALDELGLQGGQEFVLVQLAETNGCSQSDLAEALSVKPPTITKLVRKLEESGLVERHQDPDDARVQQVFLTQAGEETIEPIEECWKQGEEVMLDGFTTEERLLLRRMLIQVQENIDMPFEKPH